MILVVAVSTSGFAINKHYCGGKEKAKALFLEAEKCAFEYKKVCQNHPGDNIDRKDCCSDEASFFKQALTVDLEISHDINDFDLAEISNQDHVVVKSPRIKSDKTVFTYRPPPIERDLNILFDSFLL